MTSNISDTPKPRYELLDGLRGVAAIMVIFYHIGECFATSVRDQWLNHGYLAVDFFFVLSGFVISYAYDGRWKRGMTEGGFLLRRIIRLQPMVVIGVILGVISFIIQGCEQWDGTSVNTSAVILSLILGLFMLPALPGTAPEVRGNGEMFPLNGPSWSLFFEYIGSILYAIVLHKLPRRALQLVVALSGVGLAACAFSNMSGVYSIGVGWSMADGGFFGGFLRLSFSFSLGLLMSRDFKPRRIRGAFWLCATVIAALMACPYVGGDEPSAWNAAYDLLCTLVIFPAVVYIGACGNTTDAFSSKVCNFLGGLSYPLYIVHYPIMYMFYAWVWSHGYGFAEVWPVCAVLFPGILIFAWLVMRYYDTPVRRSLTRRLLTK